jgi:predicted DNA-binding transcriptional regulator AlpA
VSKDADGLDPDDLVTLADIAAELGTKSRSVVANWVKRYDDFPEPVLVSRTGSVKLWSREAVLAWVEASS